MSEVSCNLGAGLLNQAGTELPPRRSQMQECPQCRKLFDPVPMSGDFCPDCTDTIRNEFSLPAIVERVRARGLALIVSRRKQKQPDVASPAKESRTRIVLSFAIHQFIGTWGVAVTVP